jgi:uncharacterized membrane protein YhaH (DUF805 family)
VLHVSNEGLSTATLIAAFVLMLWVRLAASFKRFHDVNLSGYYFLLFVVPIVNVFLFFYLIFKRGDPDLNDYGPPLKYF